MTGIWRLGRRPALDGLRGVAVLLVVADHAGFLPMPAGAVGVTVFFVLSGFLITRVMVEARRAERWTYRAFVGNRAARLVPALVVMVTVVTVWWLLSGRPTSAIVGPVVAALLYVADFTYPHSVGGVLNHTWSLAVEEQFYLVWPLVLPLVIQRWQRWLGAALVASLLIRLVMIGGDLERAFAAPYTNAYGLLAGCWLALEAPRLRPAPRWVTPVAMAALAAAVLVWGGSGSIASLYFGPAVGAAAAVALIWGGLQGGPLTVSPLRFFGRISYALYLWHWPTLWLTGTARDGLSALPVVLLSMMVATCSTMLLEEPIRRWWRSRLDADLRRLPVDHLGVV